MYMVRHDFHSLNTEIVICRNLHQIRFQVIVDAVPKDCFTIFCTPYNVILNAVHISTTICKIIFSCIINTFIHVIIIAYAVVIGTCMI